MLAERMNTFSGSPTSALIAKVAELRAEGKDIISLNVGEPDFGVLIILNAELSRQ